MRFLESNKGLDATHLSPASSPSQELSAPATALTLLLLRTRIEHPTGCKDTFSVSSEEWNNLWPQRGVMACGISSLAVGKGRKAVWESDKTHPICGKISEEKRGFLYIIAPFYIYKSCSTTMHVFAGRQMLPIENWVRKGCICNERVISNYPEWPCVKNLLIPAAPYLLDAI